MFVRTYIYTIYICTIRRRNSQVLDRWKYGINRIFFIRLVKRLLKIVIQISPTHFVFYFFITLNFIKYNHFFKSNLILKSPYCWYQQKRPTAGSWLYIKHASLVHIFFLTAFFPFGFWMSGLDITYVVEWYTLIRQLCKFQSYICEYEDVDMHYVNVWEFSFGKYLYIYTGWLHILGG